MALPHAQPLDVVRAAPLGPALADAVSTSLIKTARLQLLHLVLHEHADLHKHRVAHECVVHCLEGRVDVLFDGGRRALQAGELLVVPPGLPHAVQGRGEQAAVLLTLLLDGGDAGDHGGAVHFGIPPS